jgi:putative transposase
MPAAKPPEFRRRAVELARQREKPIAQIASDFGIAETCLRRWMKQDDVDSGRTEGVSTDERAELVRLRRELRVAQMEIEILKRASAYFARENVLPRWGSAGPRARRGRQPAGRCHDGLPSAGGLPLGLLRVARPGAQRSSRGRRAAEQHHHRGPCRLPRHVRGAAGARRAPARPGAGVRAQAGRPADAPRRPGRGSVTGANGTGPARRRPCTPIWCSAGSSPTPRTGCGSPTSPSTPPPRAKSTAPPCSTSSAEWWSAGRSPTTCAPSSSSTPWRWPAGAAVPNQGPWSTATAAAQYTSWIFGHRLRAAGLLGSMGRVASSVDNGMIESLWSILQREPLDRRSWTTKAELGSAIFEWIEAVYNARRRHSALGYLSPVQFEALHTPALTAA